MSISPEKWEEGPGERKKVYFLFFFFSLVFFFFFSPFISYFNKYLIMEREQKAESNKELSVV